MPIPPPVNTALKNLPTYQPGRPIEEVAREVGLPTADIIKLASNENPLGPSPAALAAMQKVLANINRQINGAYVVLASAVLFALIGAWWGSERFILRPLRALAAKAERYGQGDFSFKAGGFKWPPEFAPLNRALEGMAEQLAARSQAVLGPSGNMQPQRIACSGPGCAICC